MPAFATALAAIALARMPSGYYDLLRLVFCAMCAYEAIEARQRRQTGLLVAYVSLAALYNPFMPIHLYRKDIWAAVNLVTVALFWLSTGRRTPSSTPNA